MAKLAPKLRHILGGFASIELKDETNEKIEQAEKDAQELRRSQIRAAARIRLLELQATPRGRHDR